MRLVRLAAAGEIGDFWPIIWQGMHRTTSKEEWNQQDTRENVPLGSVHKPVLATVAKILHPRRFIQIIPAFA